MIQTYSLTAEWRGLKRRSRVTGTDHDDTGGLSLIAGSSDPQTLADADATMTAITVIMNKAMNDPVWANGRVVLRRGAYIVKVMDVKS